MDSEKLFYFFRNASLGKPLRFTPEIIEALRRNLLDEGFDLNIDEETKASLRESQFRSLKQGRGLAIVKIFGAESAESFVEYCAYLGDQLGGKRIVSSKTGEPIEGTQGRGLQQAFADLLSIALMPEEAFGFERRLNRRIWRWLRTHSEDVEVPVEKIDENFSIYGEVPTAKTASIPVDAVALLWAYIEIQV